MAATRVQSEVAALRPSRRAALLAGAAVAFLVAGALASGAVGRAEEDPSSRPGQNAPSTITLVAPGEPGPPLQVAGQVFLPDGKTPAAGVVLYVYQTDITGRYNQRPLQAPRLRGWMKTDAEGRYQYRTVRPASYPSSSIAQHIHTQLWGDGVPAQWNKDLNFSDDPFVSAQEKTRSAAAGRFAWVCEPRRDSGGVSHCTHNLQLKTTGDEFESNTQHGFRTDPH